MTLNLIKGNIFNTKCQTIVNTINCVGVMGAGIALECRLRYPEMYKRYVSLCSEEKIKIGMLWLYKNDKKWILNFPTKNHWRFPSEESYLKKGLEKFLLTYKEKNITSIAFPLLGADKGGIPQERSFEILNTFLNKIDIEIEVYEYDKYCIDDLFIKIINFISEKEINQLSVESNIRKDLLDKIINSTKRNNITQINKLLDIEGIGLKTIEKLMIYYRKSSLKNNQSDLFEK